MKSRESPRVVVMGRGFWLVGFVLLMPGVAGQAQQPVETTLLFTQPEALVAQGGETTRFPVAATAQIDCDPNLPPPSPVRTGAQRWGSIGLWEIIPRELEFNWTHQGGGLYVVDEIVVLRVESRFAPKEAFSTDIRWAAFGGSRLDECAEPHGWAYGTDSNTMRLTVTPAPELDEAEDAPAVQLALLGLALLAAAGWRRRD